ncbi:hypothetical protein HELRODRAFT_159895 [Helobdella robusta]|uniref:SOCS box domain-containing protein n=1 Tax=Helobdella robusta TaxID=6412 RepID=T1EPI5_HELRO|nr:hypothetical protein HELRODRAFT_159895 [Helobdella robusta]ESO05819.1 hypothetical protein HELRODRAFT_159895 [Helobdella robusta]
MQKSLDNLRPNKSHRLVPISYVNEVVRNSATKIFEIINNSSVTTTDVNEAKKLIEENLKCNQQSLFTVVNSNGFTLLQCSIVKNLVPFVKLFLKKGADVNSGICSLPLHLACSLGHIEIVHMLLCYGAKADLECTVCYPEEHKIRTCPDKIFCLAYQPVYTPMMCILSGDHDSLLPLLINHENSKCQIKTEFLLHEACKMGAFACSKYLMQNYSEQIVQENKEGKTPLQISLVVDADNAKFLMNNGAEIKDTVFLIDNGSTLHEMYKRKVNLGLVKATKFALEYGFRNHINMRDNEGNTALYVLLKCVGRTVRSAIQVSYDKEVIESVKLLLVSGANPNIMNHLGETALHVVLTDSLTRQLYVNQHGQVRRLKSVLQEIYKVVEILLSHGADPGPKSAAKCLPPLFYAIHIFQSLQPEMFVVVKTALKQLFFLFSKPPCNMNKRDSSGCTMFLHLLHTSYQWLSANTSAVNPFSTSIFTFLGGVLLGFVKQGMDPNDILSYKLSRGQNTISTYFTEMLSFCSLEAIDKTMYMHIKIIITKLLQNGFDMNAFIARVCSNDPSISNDVCSGGSSSSNHLADYVELHSFYLILTQSFLNRMFLNNFQEIFSLFCNTLEQRNFNIFISSFILNTNCKSDDGREISSDVREYLAKINSVPRSLKKLCRIALCVNLKWRLHPSCSYLPLPKILVEYMLTLYD